MKAHATVLMPSECLASCRHICRIEVPVIVPLLMLRLAGPVTIWQRELLCSQFMQSYTNVNWLC